MEPRSCSFTSKLKQFKYSPGSALKILPVNEIYKNKVDYLIILSWNFSREIINQNLRFIKMGGKFIIPFHKITTIDKTNYKKLYNTITTTNKKPWYSVINAIFNNNYKNLDSKITDNKIISKLNKTKPQVEDRLIREAPAEYCTDQCKNSVKEGSCHWQYNNNFKIHVEYLTNDTNEDYLDLNKLNPFNIMSGGNIELDNTIQEKSNNRIYGGYSQISKKNRRKQRSKLRGKRYNVGGYSKIKNRNITKSCLNKKKYIKRIKSVTNH